MAAQRSRWVATLLGVLLPLTACTAARQAATPGLAERLERVHTIVLAPPRAEVFREFLDTETEVPEWSRDAERNLTAALLTHLERGGRFTVRALPADDPQAPGLPRGFKIESGSPPEKVSCLESPMPDLAERSGADALLLVRGRDGVYTHRWGSGLLGLFLIGLSPFLAPAPELAIGAGLVGGDSIRHTITGGSAEVVMCLVDPRTADTLWAASRKAKAIRDLRDPASTERLIGETLGELRAAGRAGSPPRPR